MAVSVAPMRAAETTAPTFYKDVLPILQANCQTCHRPGEVAPMSLLTYEQARPWAQGDQDRRRLQEDAAVVRRPGVRALLERARLSAPQIETLARVGRRGRARRRREGRAAAASSSRTAGTSSPTSSSRCRSRSSCRRAAPSTTSTWW